MKGIGLLLIVCPVVLLLSQCAYAQPTVEKKDTIVRTVTGPSDFFKTKESNKPDTITSEAGTPWVAMPRVDYFNLKQGNREGMPPGFYAQFVPPVPDTVKVYEGGTDEFISINTKSTREVIHGDSVAVLFEVERREALYTGSKPPKKGKTNSMITRSGFIPSQGFGSNRYRFAVTPSKFIISPGAMITASVHVLGEQKNMGTILCSVTRIDFEKNTFYIETSNEVPVGEHINWVIINFPE